MLDGNDRASVQKLNARAVAIEIKWLEQVIAARLEHFFKGADTAFDLPRAPSHQGNTVLADLISQHGLSPEARLVLALAIAPHVNSAVLDPFYVKNAAIDRAFSQFGGLPDASTAFVPTVETALFLIAGTDTAARIAAMRLFEPEHALRLQAGVSLVQTPPSQASRLDLPMHRVVALCDGTPPRPDFAPNFPARRLSTRLSWDDLILPAAIRDQLDHILAWLQNRDKILGDWGLGRQFGRGYKALFYGAPGTGKTLTATLLGQRTNLDVYRVDLSMVVSKYIGETEKNLGIIFDMAAERDWILFFDEADALFGARTATSSSNDRYANQEVSYLLQRIEECESLVILASNLRSNIDDAFFRRFQSAIGFARPTPPEREMLWRNTLASVPLAPEIDIKQLAMDYDLSGAAISNVVRHAAVSALRRGAETVAAQDLKSAIAAEMRKEGRTS
ncbi:ATP-binding protein [Roseobacter denitrificans]|uniref:AAA superfamily ATPase C-terminal domain, putative n=1 Tax=Roseobacter denitrificans (strain ATCC 33942 / OCh 114) TaxID=375451 RepID=Q160C6_ROSDO|nr:ATP-binding protein [Roseobacter denitrificans]ABG33667.1 AAA superfamily ATPase C-terminal domain, putative [Roseobacter denitrificans OCh 114]AVL52957.1 ATP-binding protein [Roseobacter denitrificans]SFG02951.1 ATPase family associated with various cellular activities (AAA) [Roseobacter denitrificans OCh 114]